MPLSSSTGARSSIAATTSGSASSAAIERSTCRPPWVLTTTPSTPSSSARRASSGCSTPLSRIGSRVLDRSQARSAQVIDGPGVDAEERLDGGAGQRRAQVVAERAGPRLRHADQRLDRGRGRPRLRAPASPAGGRPLLDQPPEHRVGRVLRDALAERERQVAEVEVARPPAEHRGVEGDHERVAAGRLGPADQALDQLVGRRPVQLEPARGVAHRRGALLHRHRRLVGEDHRHARATPRPGPPPGRPRRARAPGRRPGRAAAARAAVVRTARRRCRGGSRPAAPGGRRPTCRTPRGWPAG